jgi:hypothetical protein
MAEETGREIEMRPRHRRSAKRKKKGGRTRQFKNAQAAGAFPSEAQEIHTDGEQGNSSQETQTNKGPVIMQTATRSRFTPAARPRVSLRQAMRSQGLDEHKVARVFNRQVNRLQRRAKPKKGLPAAQEKLLLEVLKECVKIMEPAPRANATPDSSTFQLVHEIPRPAIPMRDSFSGAAE